MKILFMSDIHGVPSTLAAVLKEAERLQPDRIAILGDILYHGPRNGIPNFYDPQKVAEMLNAHANEIVAVRGNCDAEVDQMMLKFPIENESVELLTETKRFFLTHGHRWNAYNIPPIPEGTVLTHGHTHVPELRDVDGITIFNPGSISLPKCGTARSFGFFDGEKISILPVPEVA